MREIMAQRLTAPQVGASQLPAQLALPYASLLLERRSGLIGFIPASAVDTGPAPSANDIAAWYGRNLARYTVPAEQVDTLLEEQAAAAEEEEEHADDEGEDADERTPFLRSRKRPGKATPAAGERKPRSTEACEAWSSTPSKPPAAQCPAATA